MTFNWNPNGESEPPEFEMCYTDFDTVLFRCAKSLQKDYIIVTHNASGKTKEFDGVSKFYGLGKAKNKGWIGEQNVIRQEKGLPSLSVDDFTIETASRLIECPDPNLSLIEYGLQQLDFKVGAIKKTSRAADYRLGIGGLLPNFRYDAAHILPYKGERKAKPLLFLELRDAFITKYKSKVQIARDGLEQDDEISIIGWESYKHFLKTGKHKYVLAYVDKDLNSVPCPSFNYDKVEEGITYPDINECARAFCIQTLCGDKSTDNIQGLPNIGVEFAKKYNLGKPKGIGKATAIEILKDCTTPKEMYERVIEAYKGYYGVEPFSFTSHRGEVSERTWLDMLRENAILLYMCRTYDEAGKYDIEQTFKRMKIDYE
jgi:hypothetical protein